MAFRTLTFFQAAGSRRCQKQESEMIEAVDHLPLPCAFLCILQYFISILYTHGTSRHHILAALYLQGVTRDTAGESEHGFTFHDVLIMFVVDIVVFSVLAWYAENVRLPVEHSVLTPPPLSFLRSLTLERELFRSILPKCHIVCRTLNPGAHPKRRSIECFQTWRGSIFLVSSSFSNVRLSPPSGALQKCRGSS